MVYNSIIYHLCIVLCSPPQVMCLSITTYPLPLYSLLLPPLPFPSGTHHTTTTLIYYLSSAEVCHRVAGSCAQGLTRPK